MPSKRSPKFPARRKLRGYRKFESEAPRLSRSVSAGGAIGSLVKHFGYAERILEQKAVILWPSVVGETIAEVAKARAIKRGVLRVDVSDPTWRQELAYLKGEIRTKLNRAIGRNVVLDIRFS